MPANLTDNYVANTYQGVLHVNGQELPDDVKVQVYDGMGNKTAIQLGINSVDCQSLSAQGLTANDFKYPEEPGDVFNVLCQTSENVGGQINTLELRNIKDIFCGSDVGLPAYSRAKNTVVPIVSIECGIVDDVDDVEITNITSAAGGINKQETGNFNVSYVSLTGGLVKGLTLTPVAASPQPNLLINAQGIINQRGIYTGNNIYEATRATWNPRGYFLDRWKANNVSVVNWTYNANETVATINASSNGVSQFIERKNIIPGIHTLSWRGSASASIKEGSAPRTGSTVTTGDIKTITVNMDGSGDVEIKFINGLFSLPKFERGSIRSEFDYRNFGSELQLCQRYFCKTYSYGTRPATVNADGSIQSHTTEPVSNTLHNNGWRFPVTLRIVHQNGAWVISKNGNVNQFTFYERGNFDTRSAVVGEWNDNGISTVLRTGGRRGALETGIMRQYDTHYVADAEF
jgi:hypothetical protein